MARPWWAGAVSFGLVSIPISVASATEDRSVHFHQVPLEDMGRVRARKVCELENEVVPPISMSRSPMKSSMRCC